MVLIEALSGNQAAAWGAKIARVQAVIAFPITPQSELVTTLASMINEGELKAGYLSPDGEHSVMAALVGASTTGVRAFTGSCGQGISFMTENIYIAAGKRVPVVMAIPNRSLAQPGGPRSGNCDSMLLRDSGWMQFYCEDNQEILDTIIQAYKVAEDKRVYLPAQVMYEGWGLAQTTMPVIIPDQEEVDKFLPPYKHEWYSMEPLHGKSPREYGDDAQQGRYNIGQALENAKIVIKEVNEEYGKRFGRRYGNGLIEKYKCDGAKVAMITMGSITGTAKDVIDEMNEKGEPIGLVKIRSFRPFPTKDLEEAIKDFEAIGVLTRNNPYGAIGAGIEFREIAATLYSLKKRPLIIGFHTSIGRYTTIQQMRCIAKKVLKAYETGKVENEVEWIWKNGEVIK